VGKETQRPILALSPALAPGSEPRRQAPQLSDLREVGSLERRRRVLFVFRESVLLDETRARMGTDEYFKWQKRDGLVHGQAEVHHRQQRQRRPASQLGGT